VYCFGNSKACSTGFPGETDILPQPGPAWLLTAAGVQDRPPGM
jgi:hypothetical protein